MNTFLDLSPDALGYVNSGWIAPPDFATAPLALSMQCSISGSFVIIRSSSLVAVHSELHVVTWWLCCWEVVQPMQQSLVDARELHRPDICFALLLDGVVTLAAHTTIFADSTIR
jgi:hypothetical protein